MSFLSTGGGSALGTGSWTSFDPSWDADTSAPSLGNGTEVARYVQLGNVVIVHIHYVMGSTTTFGSGDWFWTLPVTPATGFASGDSIVCNIEAKDQGTNRKFANLVRKDADGSTTIRAMDVSANAEYTSAVPFTWTTNDQLTITAIYEAA